MCFALCLLDLYNNVIKFRQLTLYVVVQWAWHEGPWCHETPVETMLLPYDEYVQSSMAHVN